MGNKLTTEITADQIKEAIRTYMSRIIPGSAVVKVHSVEFLTEKDASSGARVVIELSAQLGLNPDR